MRQGRAVWNDRGVDALATRMARPGDVDAIEDYHHRCFERTYASKLISGQVTPLDRSGMRRQFRGWFEPGADANTHVVEDGGTPIAHFTVSGHQLVHLFVDPQHQHRGLGRRLLESAEAMIAADGHEQFELHARVDNDAAIAFCQRADWVVTDRVIRTTEHGISYDEHVLVKRSTAST